MARSKAEGPAPEHEDRELWRHVTRTITPLRPTKPPRIGVAPETPPASEGKAKSGDSMPAAPVRPPVQPGLGAPPPPLLTAGETPGLDSRTAERLRRGLLPVEARLDLHGHTQEEAHRALIAFVEAAWRARRRCLLVITGKGRGEGVGVLRTSVPRWLEREPLRGHLLAIAPARPKDGGAGALYVLLRRQR